MPRVILVLVSLCLASCEVCPDRLIIPVLNFELPEAEASLASQAPATVRTCLDDTCWLAAFSADAGFDAETGWDPVKRRLSVPQLRPVDELDASKGFVVVLANETSDVSLEMSRDGGTLFTHAWDDVKFAGTEANGPGCGVTYAADVLTF
ncbi:MAG: hypothetical protein ACO1OB_09365 [Archangium sp.]